MNSVSFLVQNRDTFEYFRLDGSLGAAQRFAATLSNPAGPNTSWTRTLTDLPVGEWELTVDAFDTSGQRFRLIRRFTQGGDFSPPTVDLTSGESQRVTSGNRLQFTGNATATAGIESVSVQLRNVLDRSGIQANGAFGSRAVFFNIPGTNGGTQRNWSYEPPALPNGTYDVTFRVTDTLGATDVSLTQVIVGPNGDDLPTTVFDATNRFAQGVDSLSIALSGSASDDTAVSGVVLLIFDADRGQWVQPDGSLGPDAAPFDANLAQPGTRSTTWSFEFTATAPSTYYFFVRAEDNVGQGTSVQQFGSFRAYPGDSRPTVEIAIPTANQTILSGRISATGTVADDNSVTGVEVLIRNLDTLDYLRADGSFGGFQWIAGSLTNPGGSRSNWDYQSPSLPDGRWQIQARSIDNNGQTTALIPVVNITLR